MPWRCPACRTIIHHSELEALPRRGERYRCHVCRLELMLDERAGTLTVVPESDRGDADGGPGDGGRKKRP